MANLRQTIPTDFHPLDECVYLPGTPTSSFLGQAVSSRTRWLNHRLRRTWGHFYIQGSDTIAPPLTQDHAGEVYGPFLHWGTPGVTGGNWYLRLVIPETGSVTCVPFVLGTHLRVLPQAPVGKVYGETTFTGTDGLAHNYGPIPTLCEEGPCQMGLLLLVDQSDAEILDTGRVFQAEDNIMESYPNVDLSAPFAGLTPPYPMIRLRGPDVPICEWTRILQVMEGYQAGDSVRTREPMLPPNVVVDENTKPAITWETTLAAAVEILADYFEETDDPITVTGGLA